MSYTLAYTGAEIDALLGKIDAIFVAEYGSTIYSEVTAAIAAGNKVIVANAGKVYVYAGQDDNGGYVFTQSGPNAAKPNATYVTLSTGNVWSTATVDLATLQQFYASLMEDTASGSIASFPDGAENVPVKELTAEIEPIQDLHGYSNPWPAGGGRNKIEITATTQTVNTVVFTVLKDAANNVIGVNVNGTASVNTFFVAGTTTVDSGSYTLTGNPFTSYDNTLSVRDEESLVLLNDTGTGATGSLQAGTYSVMIRLQAGENVNGTFHPMLRLSTDTDATFAPYSNLCPIEGYMGAEITRAGKNLWAHGDTTFTMRKNFPLFLKAGTYIASTKTTTTSSTALTVIIFYNKDGTDIGRFGFTANTGARVTSNIALTFAVDVYSCTVQAAPTIGGSSGQTATFTDLQIELGSTATEYEAYNGTTYSVSWSDHGTIYKGTAQYKGGGEWEITPTYGGVDLGTLAWASGTLFFDSAPIDNLRSAYEWQNSICSSYKFYNIDYMVAHPDTLGLAYSGTKKVRLYGSSYTTPEEVKAAMSGVIVVYPLINPTSFIVTGPDPETLLGDNNIWADTGDISVKYRANTALYIEKKLGGNVQTLSTPRLIGVSPSEGAFDVISGNPINIERVPLSEIKAPELDELTEAPELEPYDEPEAEEPEDLTEEPEAEEEPAEDAEAEPEKAEEPEA